MAQSPSQDERFRRVYTAHHAAIRDYCFRRLSPADANDATAEVFLVLWRRMDDAPPADESLPWLYGIARNTVANVRRSTRRRTRLHAKVASQPEQVEPGPERQVVRREEARRVLAALERLKPVEQELLRLIEA